MKTFLLTILVSFSFYLSGQEGPYAPPAGQANTTAIYKDSTIIEDWASNAVVTRGYQNITNPSAGYTSVGSDSSCLGYSGANGVVSLGDGGTVILTFNGKIYNGPGADFAVFENSFSDDFLELAFVEVSSDGQNFFRFPAVSLTNTEAQTGGFGSTDATNLYNLAGKYRGQYGTPFDLEELAGTSGLDVNAITHIKVIDVVGSINDNFASFDSQNNKVNDPYPTEFASGGFDLDAIGAIHIVPTSIEETSLAINNIYPNPFRNSINLNFNEKELNYKLINHLGVIVHNGITSGSISTVDLPAGIYFLQLTNGTANSTIKLLKQ